MASALVPCTDNTSRVIYHLDELKQTELKELKAKFMSDLQRVRSLLTQVESRELELNSVDKTSKMTGQKRAMPVALDGEIIKCKRLVKKSEVLDSTEARKVEAAMMSKCGVMLDNLMRHRHGWVFNEPVDVVALGLRDYHEVVKRPMDLGTVKSKLGKRGYRNPLDFARDVRLTFENAMLYNREGEEVHSMAAVLLDMFDKLFDPAYEKSKAERQCVIVPQKKRSKPLAECMQTQVVAFSQGETEKPLQKHPNAALVSKKVCKEVAGKAVSKPKRTVVEGKENPRKRREMCVNERDQLGRVLQDLAGEYLDEILQIVAKRHPNKTTPDGDREIELDVAALDSESMWDLHEFVRNLKPKQDNKVS